MKFSSGARATRGRQAFVIGAGFVGNDDVALILGQFFMESFKPTLLQARETVSAEKGGMVFAYHVSNPKSYGGRV